MTSQKRQIKPEMLREIYISTQCGQDARGQKSKNFLNVMEAPLAKVAPALFVRQLFYDLVKNALNGLFAPFYVNLNSIHPFLRKT